MDGEPRLLLQTTEPPLANLSRKQFNEKVLIKSPGNPGTQALGLFTWEQTQTIL